MDYDDSLTLEIPTEQPPDTDTSEAHTTGQQVSSFQDVNVAVTLGPTSSDNIGGGNTAEPDLELLGVLLKNPELVIALTSGQAGNFSSQETVKLLDMIKAGGSGLASNLNGFNTKVEEKIEVSLPSPTPSSNSGMVRDFGPCCNLCQKSLGYYYMIIGLFPRAMLLSFLVLFNVPRSTLLV